MVFIRKLSKVYQKEKKEIKKHYFWRLTKLKKEIISIIRIIPFNEFNKTYNKINIK